MTIEYVQRYEIYAKSMAIPESLKHLLVQALECHLTMVQSWNDQRVHLSGEFTFSTGICGRRCWLLAVPCSQRFRDVSSGKRQQTLYLINIIYIYIHGILHIYIYSTIVILIIWILNCFPSWFFRTTTSLKDTGLKYRGSRLVLSSHHPHMCCIRSLQYALGGAASESPENRRFFEKNESTVMARVIPVISTKKTPFIGCIIP